MIKCPGCGADMHFAPKKQLLECSYCDTEVSPDGYAEAEGFQASDSEYFDTTVFSCPNCGGEIMSLDETAATFCSYCGTSVMLASRMSKELRPKRLIPFKLDTDDCKSAYKRIVKKAIFSPSSLRKNDKIDKFRGIYMPYWSYSSEIDQNIYSKGSKEHREGDYIIKEEFNLTAKCDATYDGLSHDSASNFYDYISEGINPFETKDEVGFNPAYLSGFYVDRGDVDKNTYSEDVIEYIKDDVAKKFAKQREFSDVTVSDEITKNKLKPKEPTATAVLYPVWFLTNKFGDDRITYAVVNGQTGKVAADLPIDPKKYIFGSLLLILPFYFLLSLFPALEPKYVLIVAMVLHVITSLISSSQSEKLKKKENHEDDKGFSGNQKTSDTKDTKDTKDQKKNVNIDPSVDGCFLQIVVFIAGIILYFVNPDSDLVYYIACAVIIALSSLSFVTLIKQHNLLTSHKPPQLEARGGDEHA